MRSSLGPVYSHSGPVNSEELEGSLRYLWSKSQVPFTRENLAAHTGLSGKKLEKGLIGLVKSGVLGIDATDGEVTWSVPGVYRPIEAPETLARFERLEKMRAEVKAKVKAKALAKRTGKSLEEIEDNEPKTKRSSRSPRTSKKQDVEDPEEGGRSILKVGAGAAKGALAIVSNTAGKLDRKGTGGKKSLVASAGLSLFGPLGWFYAGSFREAVPATLLYMLAAWIIPNPILWPLLWFALPASALAGFFYALQYNFAGERRPLLLKDPSKTKDS